MKAFKYILMVLILTITAQNGIGKNRANSNDTARQFSTITIEVDPSLNWKSLALSFWNTIVDDSYIDYEATAKVCTDNKAYFKIPMPKGNIGYVTIINKDVPETDYQRVILAYNLTEANDLIFITVKPKAATSNKSSADMPLEFNFSGNGFEKFEARYKLDQIDIDAPSMIITASYQYSSNNRFDRIAHEKLRILDTFRQKISNDIYWIMSADIIGNVETAKLSTISSTLHGRGTLNPDSVKKIYEGHIEKTIPDSLPSYAKSFSMEYSNFLYYHERLLYQLSQKAVRVHYGMGFYSILKSKYTAAVKDKLITMFCIKYYALLPENKSIVKDALKTVSHLEYYDLIKSLNEKYKAKSVYNFSLPDIANKQVSLTDFKGKVVMIDYWFTGCGACTFYYKKTLKEVEEHYGNSDKVVFVTICSDVNREQWISSIKRNLYTSERAINLFTAGQGIRHPVIKELNLTSGPTPILIGKDGNIISFKGPDLYEAEILIKTIDIAIAK